jgi:hypothetical protein
MSSKNYPSLYLLFFSKFVTCFLATTLIFSGFVFLSGADLQNNTLVMPSALAITMIILTWEFVKFYDIKLSTIIILQFTTLLITTLFTVLMSITYDKSWDGMAYHQIGIVELSEGWNPFYQQLPYEALQSKYFDREIVLNLWVNHYGKALEIFAAGLMAVTGNIESGKVFNILLLLASFCSMYHLFTRLNYFSAFWNLTISFCAAVNPIAVNQLFSYYVDGAVGSLILILICQLILLFITDDSTNRRPYFVSLFFVAVILINLKFTGLIYFTWFCGIFLVFSIYSRSRRLAFSFLAASTASGLMAVFIAGFNPYVTNTVNHGHPFHPIAGKNRVDVIVHMIPQPLKVHNRFGRLLISTFSRCDNFGEGSNRNLEFKIPLTFSTDELKMLQSEGIRLGGFGPMWSGIVCLTLVAFCITLVKLTGRERIYFLVLTGAVVGAAIINPVSWWSRFVPQLWLAPLIVLCFFLAAIKNTTPRYAGRVIIILMIVNSAMVASVYCYSVYSSTRLANKVFYELKKATRPVFVYFDIFTPNIKKFEANDIPFVEVKQFAALPCDSAGQVLKIEFCRQ